jgi:hypothetical protein
MADSYFQPNASGNRCEQELFMNDNTPPTIYEPSRAIIKAAIESVDLVGRRFSGDGASSQSLDT